MLRSDVISRAVPIFAIRRPIDYILKPGAIMLAVHLLTYAVEFLIVGPDKMLPFGQRFVLSNLVAAPFVAIAFVMLTHLDRLQARLANLAMTDMLTDLPNRRAFLERSAAAPDGYLLIIDADHFKAINDTYGHAAGDLCLQAIADHLRRNTRKDDIIGRIGGEEFAAFMPGISAGELHALGLRLSGPLSVALLDQAEAVQLTLSIGAARRWGQSTIAETFHCADVALYVAKDMGRARLIIWNDAMNRRAA